MRRNVVLPAVMFALLLAPALAFAASDRDMALEILDSRTATHWGEDNLVWVVHYPEELLEPWVKSYAAKRKLNAEQTEQYRKAFSDELRTGSATAVMLSVHSFGISPLNIAPLAKNVALIQASGKRVQPIAYEKKLDSPINGLMQGFVFFPLQEGENFRIAVNGLVPERETVFAFDSSPGSAIATTAAPSAGGAVKRPQGGSEEEREDVVVKIPSTKPPTAPTPPKPPVVSRDEKQEEPQFALEGETYPPTAPPQPESPEPPADEGQDGQAEQKTSQKPQQEQPTLSPKQALDVFLKAWIRGDTDRMYELLSDESRARISKELFEKDALGAGGFRQGLRDGYKVTWEGDGAKVTVSQKLFLLRTLNSKRFGFVEEDGSARIAW